MTFSVAKKTQWAHTLSVFAYRMEALSSKNSAKFPQVIIRTKIMRISLRDRCRFAATDFGVQMRQMQEKSKASYI